MNKNVWLPTLCEKEPTDEEMKWAIDYFVKNPLVVIEPGVLIESDPDLLDSTYEAQRRRELLCLVQFSLQLGNWAVVCLSRVLEASSSNADRASDKQIVSKE